MKASKSGKRGAYVPCQTRHHYITQVLKKQKTINGGSPQDVTSSLALDLSLERLRWLHRCRQGRHSSTRNKGSRDIESTRGFTETAKAITPKAQLSSGLSCVPSMLPKRATCLYRPAAISDVCEGLYHPPIHTRLDSRIDLFAIKALIV